jgi:hypothetical protein
MGRDTPQNQPITTGREEILHPCLAAQHMLSFAIPETAKWQRISLSNAYEAARRLPTAHQVNSSEYR